MRVAIADTNTTVIEALVNLLAVFPHYEILWIARNKNEAIERAKENSPDLLLLDIHISAAAEIMKNSPCSILLVTKGPMDQHMQLIFEGMGQGALDVISLAGSEKGAFFFGDILRKIDSIARILGMGHDIPRETIVASKEKPAKQHVPLLLIGASTGGPAALVKIFKALSTNNPFATILIQHIDDKFSSGMATWLQEQTSVPVQLLERESHPIAGTVFLASQRNHIVCTSEGTVAYTSYPVNQIYTPSIDVLFISAAKYWPTKSFGVLLTGMGNDGARGLRVLHDAGWHTIAQHEKSCVVYGMPKAAIEMDAAKYVLNIEEIAPRLLKLYHESYKHTIST